MEYNEYLIYSMFHYMEIFAIQYIYCFYLY